MTSALTSSVRMARLSLATGVTLHCAEAGDPDATPLLLLHGYTDSWRSFSGIIPALARRFRVVAPDQRGHGESQRPASGYAVTDFARDALALLDVLGLERVAVLGHSMGSLVAQEIALGAPHRLGALVLAGSTAHMRSPDTLALQAQVESLDTQVPAEFVRGFQRSTCHQPIDPGFLEEMVRESLKVPAFVWRAALAAQLAHDSTARLARIRIPTLILRGGEDRIFTVEAQDALAECIPGAHQNIYPATGHAVHWERPAEVARAVVTFLQAAEAMARA